MAHRTSRIFTGAAALVAMKLLKPIPTTSDDALRTDPMSRSYPRQAGVLNDETFNPPTSGIGCSVSKKSPFQSEQEKYNAIWVVRFLVKLHHSLCDGFCTQVDHQSGILRSSYQPSASKVDRRHARVRAVYDAVDACNQYLDEHETPPLQSGGSDKFDSIDIGPDWRSDSLLLEFRSEYLENHRAFMNQDNSCVPLHPIDPLLLSDLSFASAVAYRMVDRMTSPDALKELNRLVGSTADPLRAKAILSQYACDTADHILKMAYRDV